MIYSFTSTGYEVAECNYENFIKNEIIKLEESKNYFSDKEIMFIEPIDENNGITLCEKCHNNFHSIYGKRHNTLQQLNEFLGYIFMD